MIDSKQFYQYLQDTFAQTRRQLADMGTDEVHIYIHSMQPWGGEAPEISITIDSKNSSMKVEGKNMQECVEEYIRRSGFQARQKLAMLEAPKANPTEVNHMGEEQVYPPGQSYPPEPPISNPLDDEIQF